MIEKALLNIKSIRILPSDTKTFPSEKDFRFFIESTMIERGGLYYFPNQMMVCNFNTLTLFQYNGKIRAVGILIDAKKVPTTDEKNVLYGGYYKFDIATLTYLALPIDSQTLQNVYPGFISFNQSKQVVPIEYLNDILSLIQQDDNVKNMNLRSLVGEISKEIETIGLIGKDVESYVKVRVNQTVFRDRLLNKYHKCCLCGITNPDLLVASHIKPWCKSNPSEKVDVNNGILLCPNHDRLFDGGYISFDSDGTIIVSPKLSELEKHLMGINKEMKIHVSDKNERYLKYHRSNIFKK